MAIEEKHPSAAAMINTSIMGDLELSRSQASDDTVGGTIPSSQNISIAQQPRLRVMALRSVRFAVAGRQQAKLCFVFRKGHAYQAEFGYEDVNLGVTTTGAAQTVRLVKALSFGDDTHSQIVQGSL